METDFSSNPPFRPPLYPFRFDPIYKDYIWGGNRFQTLFGRTLPDGDGPFAESWEIADHANGQSLISNGPLHGISLRQLVSEYPQELFGERLVDPNHPPHRFPLILKYLDACQNLSVQVHPDDNLAWEMGLKDPGKTEVWVVVQAEKGSKLWLGTQRDYSRSELEDIIRKRELKSVLCEVEVHPGDCFYLRPGTLHALGSGILVAEVQTSSDTTFRVYDWDRLDKNGQLRELKIEEAIRALDDVNSPVFPQRGETGLAAHCERLVVDEHFTVNRWTSCEPFQWNSDGRCHLWTVLKGTGDAIFQAGRRGNGPDAIESLNFGDSMLIPAMCPEIRWIPENNETLILLDAVVTKV